MRSATVRSVRRNNGKPLRSFHNASGYPLINTTRFPDMKTMTTKAHDLGLKIG